MFKVIKKEIIAENVVRVRFVAPHIAHKRQPGQFVIVRLQEGGERIPLTIVDSNAEEGTVDIIVQAVGKNTRLLYRIEAGQHILDVVGPLGNPTHLERYGTCVLVGGGVGIAPLFPIAQGLKAKGNKLIGILGARQKELLILSQEFQTLCEKVYVVTDDGSSGKKGLVTDALAEVIASGEEVHFVTAVGPVVMMEAIAQLTKKHDITTMVSLNPIMIDGTGMCGGCRCIVGGEVKFACIDGPEFDGHLVDYASLKRRLTMFKKQEKQLHERDENCKLNDR